MISDKERMKLLQRAAILAEEAYDSVPGAAEESRAIQEQIRRYKRLSW